VLGLCADVSSRVSSFGGEFGESEGVSTFDVALLRQRGIMGEGFLIPGLVSINVGRGLYNHRGSLVG
jgi:hypothetical protein